MNWDGEYTVTVATGYATKSAAETAISRWKQLNRCHGPENAGCFDGQFRAVETVVKCDGNAK